MRTPIFIAILSIICRNAPAAEPWRTAEPGWRFEWPRDHVTHDGFKTEWWYFTGNLDAEDGRRFGFQLTLFRSGVRPPGSPPSKSRFVRDAISLAHFTVSDPRNGTFHHAQRLTRGAFGEAGFGDGKLESRLAWLDSWQVSLNADGTMRLRADDAGRALDLTLESTKPWAVHGIDGISRKSEGDGHASHYYSGTRMRSRGTLTLDGRAVSVTGESWLDREWGSNPMSAEQVGWDWFSVQFDDGTELMLYRLRRRDGTIDAASSGSLIAADGTVRHLRVDEFETTALRRWRSPGTGGEYPVEWRVRIPSVGLDVKVSTPIDAQELALKPVTYWEGMIDVGGIRQGHPIKGRGYLEMTGYAGEVIGLRAGPMKP